MPQSHCSTPSQLSYHNVADKKKDDSTDKTSSLSDCTASRTSSESMAPREARISLPLQQRNCSTGGKRTAHDESAGHRIVRARRDSSRTSASGEWMFVKSGGEVARPRLSMTPVSRRQERIVRNDSDNHDSKTDSDTDYIVVEDGKDGFVPETSMRGSNPFVVTSRKSNVNGDQMIRSDVSSTRTHPASTSYNSNVTDISVSVSVVHLTASSITAALVGVGSQFADPSPFTRLPVDDWIKV